MSNDFRKGDNEDDDVEAIDAPESSNKIVSNDSFYLSDDHEEPDQDALIDGEDVELTKRGVFLAQLTLKIIDSYL